MKKNLKISALLLLLFSCTGEEGTLTLYNVKNNTEHNINVTLYNFQVDQSLSLAVDSTIRIAPDGEFLNQYGGYTSSGPYRYPLGESTDSVIIVFDDSRKLVYRRSELNANRNILNIENYVERVSEDNNLTTYTYTYTVTGEDYNNAVPIEE